MKKPLILMNLLFLSLLCNASDRLTNKDLTALEELKDEIKIELNKEKPKIIFIGSPWTYGYSPSETQRLIAQRARIFKSGGIPELRKTEEGTFYFNWVSPNEQSKLGSLDKELAQKVKEVEDCFKYYENWLGLDSGPKLGSGVALRYPFSGSSEDFDQIFKDMHKKMYEEEKEEYKRKKA